MCTKNEIKIHHTRAQKRGDWIDSKSPEGTRRIGPPFPIKSNTKSDKSMDYFYSKEKNGGRETQGWRPGRKSNSRTSYKSHNNLIQVKGYLYPRRLVRPVPWTGQTGWSAESPCTRSHLTAEVLSSQRTLLHDAAILMKIWSTVLEGP